MTVTALHDISWKRAIGLAVLSLHGPFFVMAAGALIFVSSSHAKTYAWVLLPCAPGLIPVEAARAWLLSTRLADGVLFTTSFLVSAVLVVALAALIRRGRVVRWISLTLALIVFSIGAFSLLSMLRS